MTFTKGDADRLRRLHERVGETGDLNDDIRFAEECLILVPRALAALEEAWELLRTIRKKAFGATPHNEQLSLYLLAKAIGEAADEHLRAAEEG